MRAVSRSGAALTPRGALSAALLAVVAGCSGGGSSQGGGMAPPVVASPPPTPPPRQLRKYIKHVVVIVQENRSFDDLFHGFPGARYATYGYMHDGTRVTLRPTTLTGPDISHVWDDAIVDWDHGKMDGYDLNPLGPGRAAGRYAYQYVDPKYIRPYWSMAKQYVLADHMFSTMFGGSFTAHLDLIAGTTDLQGGLAEVDVPLGLPWGCDAAAGTRTSTIDRSRTEAWGRGPFPCFTQFATMADLFDAANVSWAYYAPQVSEAGGRVWSEFDAMSAVRHGPDWKRNVISPPSRVLQDAADGRLPDVAWVIPDVADSDHAGERKRDTGPAWVASVVNAIGQSAAWDSTAIVVLWDDWGGWFDSVPPPQLDYRGLGERVPCIVISPYAKKGYVSHTTYEFGSVLALMEEAFALPPLESRGFGSGYTDQRAYSMTDAFDFKHPPRRFRTIGASYGRTYFLARPPSLRPPDDE